MRDIVLFSQAPADLQYIVSLYEKYQNHYTISIFVVNVENNYIFLKKLNLKAKLFFIPSQKIKSFKIIPYSFFLKQYYKEKFKYLKKAKVYFFSKYYDITTFFFIDKLKQNNEVFFFDLYRLNGKKSYSLKTYILKSIVKLLFGLKLAYIKLGDSLACQYIFDDYIQEIEINHNKDLLKKYLFKPSFDYTNKKKILFFETNYKTNDYYLNYENTLSKILSILLKDYEIYIKSHPRLGSSIFLNQFNLKFIENHIPAEFIDTNSFCFVMGIDTAAVALIGHSNKISLLQLFDYKNIKDKEKYQEYLKNLSDNVRFIYSLKELENL